MEVVFEIRNGSWTGFGLQFYLNLHQKCVSWQFWGNQIYFGFTPFNDYESRVYKLNGYFWLDPPGPPPTLSLNKEGFAAASHFFPSFKPQQWLLGSKQRDRFNKKTTIVKFSVMIQHKSIYSVCLEKNRNMQRALEIRKLLQLMARVWHFGFEIYILIAVNWVQFWTPVFLPKLSVAW